MQEGEWSSGKGGGIGAGVALSECIPKEMGRGRVAGGGWEERK